MANRPRSKGKDRIPAKRGTSVMSEPAEALGGRGCKYQRSHSSSLADYDDLQSTFTADTGGDGDDQDDMRMTPSPTPSDEPRGSRSGRQNHSEIEKRRRDKMNTYITELSRVVPMCITMSHKLDKLTVLRMAVQHLKTIRGAIHSYTEGDYKPSFLSDEELKRLILQSADGFLFVVGCDRGRMLYVSESVSQVLNYSQGDLLGQSWFDILHPKDVAKVKEQLSSSDLSPRERLIDAKTMLPVKADIPQGLPRLCPGARRSFFCRMKCRATAQSKDNLTDPSGNPSAKHRKTQNLSKEKKYVVIHCTGYLKSWAPAKIGVSDQDSDGDVDACNLSCLVAVGRVQPSIATANSPRDFVTGNQFSSGDGGESCAEPRARPHVLDVEFISRHTIDGKFLFVDQRATLLLGLLPQELLGTSMYEYYHVDDIVALTEAHKASLQTTETITTPVYRFRIKEGTYVRLQSRWKSFRNPWTKEVEFLVAKNVYIAAENTDSFTQPADSMTSSYSDLFSPASGMGVSNNSTRVRLMNVEVEASKIGQTVAEEVMDSQRSRSQSSVAGISPSNTNRSPGSIISPASTVGSFPDGQMETPEKQSVNSTSGIMQGSFPSEEMRRTSLSANGSQSMQTTPTGIPMNSNRTEMAAQFDASGAGTSNAGSGSGGGGGGGGGGDNNGIVPARTSNQGASNSNSSQNNARNNGGPPMTGMLSEAGLHADENMMEVLEGLMLDQSRNGSRETNVPGDGNDEAAMAVVMSLLEADAGLGGPVDFSGLPWPLP